MGFRGCWSGEVVFFRGTAFRARISVSTTTACGANFEHNASCHENAIYDFQIYVDMEQNL